MKIERGKKALTGQGFRHNIEVMKDAGYGTKRAQGMAYGEAGMAKKAMRDESKGMKDKNCCMTIDALYAKIDKL